MHEPTPAARRVAALRFQAEQLLRDAAAWGYTVSVDPRASDPVYVAPMPCPDCVAARRAAAFYYCASHLAALRPPAP